MFRNYLKIGFRHLRKNKLYAVVNILGLAIGIAGCLLIGLYIANELSYDKFHKNADRIARVTWEYKFEDAPVKVAATGTRPGPQFQRTFPEVEEYVRLMKYSRVIGYQDKLFEEKNFLYADSAFFSVFSFPLLRGNPATVLDAPEKLVLTESLAKKYFGNEDPIGKTVKVGGTKDFVVTGIVADPPSNSQVKFDLVGSFKTLNAASTEKWNEANYITYLLLKQNTNLKQLQGKIDAYARKVSREEMQLDGSNYMTFHLEPLTSVHLYSSLDGLEPNNSIVYIYVLAAVALLILIVASVNYTNLAVAQSAGRNGEIGMRKVMGAEKKQIFNQFITESFLISLFAVIIAFVLSILLLPYFNKLSGKELGVGEFLNPVFVLSLLSLAIVVAFAAGSYPAIVLSQAKIISILKSGFRFNGSGNLRRSLIVIQFIIAIFLVVGTITILEQLSYIRNKDIGMNKEHVVVLPLDAQIVEHYDDFKAAIAQQPGVVSAGAAYESPITINWGDGLRKPNDGKSITISALPADEDFAKTLQLNFIAGSGFSHSDLLQMDTSNDYQNYHYSFILNEAAVKALGWTPEEAIGKVVKKGKEGTIKGVVKDFHFRSFHEAINPLAIFLDKTMLYSMFIRINGNTPGVLRNLEMVWKQRVQHRPFNYQFLDEDFNNLYKAEERTAALFTSFSTLAIFLACLGLFALTAFTMARRTKEIGIRKILGASIPNILALVSKDFLKLVALAMIIAIPISWFAVNKWLEGFVYRISLSAWVFVIAGCFTLFIAFAAIALQAIKTALANPVKNLRTE
jgi:putative ABC transport system permease protein